MATKLVSMKLDAGDREKSPTAAADSVPDMPVYPWGLQVRLDDGSLDKLGMDSLPKVDSERILIAKVKVVSVSSNASTGGNKHRSVELQITSMCLEPVPAEKDTAEELYKG